MDSLDTWQGIASQETIVGHPAWASGIPESNRPTQLSECGNSAVRSSAIILTGIIGNREVEIILDS